MIRNMLSPYNLRYCYNISGCTLHCTVWYCCIYYNQQNLLAKTCYVKYVENIFSVVTKCLYICILNPINYIRFFQIFYKLALWPYS